VPWEGIVKSALGLEYEPFSTWDAEEEEEEEASGGGPEEEEEEEEGEETNTLPLDLDLRWYIVVDFVAAGVLVVVEANERERDEDKGDICLSITVGDVPRVVANLDAVTKFFVDCCLPLVVPAATADAAGVVDDASWWCCCVVFNNNDDDDDDDDDGGDGDNASDDLWAWFSIFLCCRDNPDGNFPLVGALEVLLLEGE